MTHALTHDHAQARPRMRVIDCDIHNAPASGRTLLAHLDPRWHRRYETFGMGGYPGSVYPRNTPQAARTDAWPPSGLPAGADLPFLREQLLEAWGIDYGILNPLVPVTGPHAEYSAALASAVNDWQVAEWLDPEPRLRASLVVAHEDSDLAVAEIDRLGGDPRFVQALLLVRTREPLGKRRFWPIYEAAARRGLPIGIHFGGAGGSPFTGAGWPSFYLEDHGGMPQAFQAS